MGDSALERRYNEWRGIVFFFGKKNYMKKIAKVEISHCALACSPSQKYR